MELRETRRRLGEGRAQGKAISCKKQQRHQRWHQQPISSSLPSDTYYKLLFRREIMILLEAELPPLVTVSKNKG